MNIIYCIVCKEEEVLPERFALGYFTCLGCGEEIAKQKTRKQHYTDLYDFDELQDIVEG